MKNSIALLRTFKTRFLNKKKGFSQNGSKEGEREKKREGFLICRRAGVDRSVGIQTNWLLLSNHFLQSKGQPISDVQCAVPRNNSYFAH